MSTNQAQNTKLTTLQTAALQALMAAGGTFDYQLSAFGFGPQGIGKSDGISPITVRSLVNRGLVKATRHKTVKEKQKLDQVSITRQGEFALGETTKSPRPARKSDEIALCLLAASGGSLDYQLGILGFGLVDAKKQDRIPLRTAESLIEKGLAVATRYRMVKGKQLIDRITY